MIDWGRLTLLFYILMRMSGFVLFNPLLGRRNLPGIFRAGLTLVLTWFVASFTKGTAPVPAHLIEFGVRLLLELGVGFMVGMTVQFFIYLIPQQAGEIIDNQMGMSMSKEYDPASNISMSVSSTLFTTLMTLLFFAANGHNTLLRILLTSGEIIPFGQAALGQAAMQAGIELFIECFVLGVKLAVPILAAELLGQIGMGVLMKVIPQINVFSINIELKVIIGLVLLMLFMSPISEFMLRAENEMLVAVRETLTVLAT
ncbi:flagellar biosynthetic protein FliR [Oscillibacter sp.]|uniref:flagellar biosynthetic protein FliR n=1 Tax=Oscillibacter sp. TaxID=1945593 RepID=UPI00289DFE13|nr:flagellar biosynthetic protein FliR [Oscillibacter sp.]